jgi:hypothetical protein
VEKSADPSFALFRRETPMNTERSWKVVLAQVVWEVPSATGISQCTGASLQRNFLPSESHLASVAVPCNSLGVLAFSSSVKFLCCLRLLTENKYASYPIH